MKTYAVILLDVRGASWLADLIDSRGTLYLGETNAYGRYAVERGTSRCGTGCSSTMGIVKAISIGETRIEITDGSGNVWTFLLA